MNPLERQARIVERLRVKPINHGQLETDQLVVPPTLAVSQEQKNLLRESLERQGTNLIPIIVRKTDEDGDYEVVFGAECCLAAQELKLPRVWVWMFDLDDEQAAAIGEEMALLMGGTEYISQPVIEEPSSSSETLQLLKTISRQLEQFPKHSITLTEIKDLIDERLIDIDKKLTEILENIPRKLDLSKATLDDLIAKGFTKPQSTAAFLALTKCKNQNELSWQALENCVNPGKAKVKNFGVTTLQKLRAIGRIPGDAN